LVVAAIISPQIIDLTGANAIVQGSDYFLEFVVKDVDGAVVNLTGVVASTDIKCEFRDKTLQQGGVTTNCPVPQLYVSNATQGKILLMIPNGQTKQFDNQVLSGKWDIELTLAGLRYRIVQGNWTNDAKQVTRRYNS
jgi:hypothetical protein